MSTGDYFQPDQKDQAASTPANTASQEPNIVDTPRCEYCSFPLASPHLDMHGPVKNICPECRREQPYLSGHLNRVHDFVNSTGLPISDQEARKWKSRDNAELSTYDSKMYRHSEQEFFKVESKKEGVPDENLQSTTASSTTPDTDWGNKEAWTEHGNTVPVFKVTLPPGRRRSSLLGDMSNKKAG